MKKQRSRIILCLALLAVVAGCLFLIFQRFQDSSDSHPDSTKINFDLLDEARPMDLIEMSLDFPESLSSLEGKRVKIVGFMAPYDSLKSMEKCMLFPSYVGCSFCTPPSMNQVIFVQQEAGKGAGQYPFIEPPSDVSGILRLMRDDSEHVGHLDGFIYVLDDAEVTPHLGTEAPIPQGHGDRNISAADHRPAELKQISLEELADEVAKLRELSLIRPIQFSRISEGEMWARVNERVEAFYPTELSKSMVALFELLGFFAEDSHPDWVLVMTSLGVNMRVCLVGPTGDRIEVLEKASTADPYTRLELVKEIADALVLQHFTTTAKPPKHTRYSDSSRALEGLRQGNKQLTAYRYSRLNSISPASSPPEALFSSLLQPQSASPLFDRWYFLPWETGPFFVEARTGATKGLSRIDSLFKSPPRATKELFRPLLYPQKLSKEELVPTDFAEQVQLKLSEQPILTDQLGLGGLIPWMAAVLPVDQAKAVCGYLLSDRFALWDLGDDGHVVLIESRWPDQARAKLFAESVPPHLYQVVEQTTSQPFTVKVIRAEKEAGLLRVTAK